MPLVARAPVSSTVKLGVPLDWRERRVLVAALVSLTTIAVPVPALVSAKPVALPLLARVNEVGVARPDAKVKAILLPVVVVMVLPPLYADCRVTVLAEHLVTLFEPSIHRAVPADPGVVKPFNVKKLEPLVLTTTPFEPVGEKVD